MQQVYGWEREAPGGAQGEEMRCVYEQTQEKKKARAEAYLVPQPETHRLAQLNTLDDWMQNEGACSDPAARAAVRDGAPSVEVLVMQCRADGSIHLHGELILLLDENLTARLAGMELCYDRENGLYYQKEETDEGN